MWDALAGHPDATPTRETPPVDDRSAASLISRACARRRRYTFTYDMDECGELAREIVQDCHDKVRGAPPRASPAPWRA